MQVIDKLRELKEIEDKNKAVDQAFLAGVQSVTPLREFTMTALTHILEAVRGWNARVIYAEETRTKKRLLLLSAETISNEINRREGLMPHDNDRHSDLREDPADTV